MPPFSWLAGHMLAVKTVMEKLPANAATHYTFADIALQSKESMFYVDFWPISDPLLVITSPFAAEQLSKHPIHFKPSNIVKVMESLTGGPSLLTMPETQWKQWRTIFNPGFSPSYILDQVPKILPEIEVFREKLREQALLNKFFQLDKMTLRFSLEVIGIVAL